MVSALVSRYPVQAQAVQSWHQFTTAPWLQPYRSQKRWSTRLWVLTEQNAKLDVLADKVGYPSGWQELTEDSEGEQLDVSSMLGPHGKCSPGHQSWECSKWEL